MITFTEPDARTPVPSSPPVHEPSGPLLRAFLAGRDLPCPACGYNLRGNANGSCPECGETLTLHLQPAGPMTRRAGLVVLVFLWLLATSAVQGYVAGRSIHAAATNPLSRFIKLNLSGVIANTPNLSLQRNSGGAITLLPNPSVTPSPSPAAGRGQWSYTWPQSQIAGAPGTYNWAAVTWRQWTSAAVWIMLGLTAISGFILLSVLRRRPHASPALARTVTILAWTGFGGFCTMQLATSVLGLL